MTPLMEKYGLDKLSIEEIWHIHREIELLLCPPREEDLRLIQERLARMEADELRGVDRSESWEEERQRSLAFLEQKAMERQAAADKEFTLSAQQQAEMARRIKLAQDNPERGMSVGDFFRSRGYGKS